MNQKLEKARARVLAKKFLSSIPSGMALPIPEEHLQVLDKASDCFVQEYMACLKEYASAQRDPHLGICWSKT